MLTVLNEREMKLYTNEIKPKFTQNSIVDFTKGFTKYKSVLKKLEDAEVIVNIQVDGGEFFELIGNFEQYEIEMKEENQKQVVLSRIITNNITISSNGYNSPVSVTQGAATANQIINSANSEQN